ncbi:hypothetical protein P8452_14510 [Trifolium repens]|nr:hypothetical protein P8452_14510 [Trifolium repens]
MRWWDTIKEDLITILRNISKGLLFLCSKNRLDVGGWFVTQQSKGEIKGKIIPSMKGANAFGKDLKSYMLQSIILPDS